ncbi:thiamine-phosphate pyrophosphorylase [Asanoa ferruginea]|uniref:Thiamine-phosphate pyrophosphorylase n=1 Tax=Asanoa ferruginea TaxID=53367 RepID=A0A3D9ZRZ3_9ACTN|nr:thiamine phosphate synthase [Asanoa ferruginea]REG00179.1 thiamine-phosphate pyrophosphorylase [Asanoa ferruginea]GIF46122.1 hypothetical protein Afe04nite_06610 [Asanoa ferruginea]
MRLPRLLVLTDRAQCAGPLSDTVAAAVAAGARAVLLREKDLPAAERAALAADLAAILAPVGGILVMSAGGPAGKAGGDLPGEAGGSARGTAGDGLLGTAGGRLPGTAGGGHPGTAGGGSGNAAWGSAVHLAAREPFPTARPALVGRSCHDAAEVAAAAAEGCDYVTVSPVYLSASKPGYGPPLGPPGLAALTRNAPPVYALGGVSPAEAAACRAAGAYGVAVMGAVMRDPDSVADYLRALTTVEDRP